MSDKPRYLVGETINFTHRKALGRVASCWNGVGGWRYYIDCDGFRWSVGQAEILPVANRQRWKDDPRLESAAKSN